MINPNTEDSREKSHQKVQTPTKPLSAVEPKSPSKKT